MPCDSHYAGFPRDLSDGRERTVYQPKDESWRADANCLGVDPDLMFPERGGDIAAAKEPCKRCVARDECLEYALTEPFELWGVWGGTCEKERKKLRKERASA